jgi:hypothetical protein
LDKRGHAVGAKERQIRFIHTNGMVVHDVSLDSYRPGDIQETRKVLAQQMNCSAEDIRVKITGIRHGKAKKAPSVRSQLIDGKALRDFFSLGRDL